MEETARSFAGREFGESELELIKEIVKIYPRLSRTELAATICENIGWTTHSGTSKSVQCMGFLDELVKEGIIWLPERTKKPRGQNAHLYRIEKEGDEISGDLADYESIELQIAEGRQELKRWRSYVNQYHYLGDRQVFGTRLYYFIKSGEHELGCLQFSASAWILSAREEWIGWSETDRKQRLHLIINNSRFLIYPWIKIKNLASKILAIAGKQIKEDWLKKYCYEPVLLETFVDSEKYRGTCYQAANWICIEQTAGRGRMDQKHRNEESRKAIYMYPLTQDFRAYLKGEKPYKVVSPDEN